MRRVNCDFQDLRLWRRQAADLAVGLIEEYGRPVLVPMTLANLKCVGEIFGALKDAGIDVDFFLKVSREVLEKRIDGRSFTPGNPGPGGEGDREVASWPNGGSRSPWGVQRLLRHTRWDADAVRDDLSAYAAEHPGADGGQPRHGHTPAR